MASPNSLQSRRSSEVRPDERRDSGRHDNGDLPPPAPRALMPARIDSYRPNYEDREASNCSTQGGDIGSLLNSFAANLHQEFVASFQVNKADRTLSSQRKKADNVRRASSSNDPFLETTEKAVAAAQADATEAKRQLQQQEENRSSTVSRITDALRFSQSSSGPVSELRLQFDAVTKAHEREKAVYQDEIKTLRRSGSDLKIDFKRVEAGATDAEKKAKALEDDLQTARSTIQSLQQRLDSHASDVELLKENNKSALEKVAEFEAEREALEQQVSEHESIVNEIKENDTARATQITNLQHNLDERASSQISKELEGCKSRISQLQQEASKGATVGAALNTKGDITRLQQAINEKPSKDDVKAQLEKLTLLINENMSSDQVSDTVDRCKTEILDTILPQQEELVVDCENRFEKLDHQINALKVETQDSLDCSRDSFQQQSTKQDDFQRIVNGNFNNVGNQLRSLKDIMNFLEDRYNSTTTEHVVQAMCFQMRRIYPQESVVVKAEFDDFQAKTFNFVRAEVDSIAKRTAYLNKLQAELATKHNTLDQIEQTRSARVQDVFKKTADLTDTCNKINERVTSLYNSNQTLEQQQTTVTARVRAVDGMLESINEQSASKPPEHSHNVESQLSDIRNGFQAADETIVARLETLQTELRDMKASLDARQNHSQPRTEAPKPEYSKVFKKLENMKSRNSGMRMELEELKKSVQNIEKASDKVEAVYNKQLSRVAELDEWKCEVEGLKEKVLDLEASDRNLTEKVDECQAKSLLSMGQARSGSVDTKRKAPDKPRRPNTPAGASAYNETAGDTIDLTDTTSPAHSTRHFSQKRGLQATTSEASPQPSATKKRKKDKGTSSPFSVSYEKKRKGPSPEL